SRSGPPGERHCLFDDLYDPTATRLDDHRPVVHDRIPVARRHMILAGHRVERYASHGQHLAHTHLAGVPECRTVLAYDVFAKPRALLDAQNAADGTGCGTDGSTNNRAEG